PAPTTTTRPSIDAPYTGRASPPLPRSQTRGRGTRLRPAQARMKRTLPPPAVRMGAHGDYGDTAAGYGRPHGRQGRRTGRGRRGRARQGREPGSRPAEMTAHPRPRSAVPGSLLDPPSDRSLIDPLAPHVDWVPASPGIHDIDGCVFESEPPPLAERLPAEQHARLRDPAAADLPGPVSRRAARPLTPHSPGTAVWSGSPCVRRR